MTDPVAGRVVVCRVGAERFALPITAVREIIAAPELTRIPGVSATIRGVANVRGTLVTAVSGRSLLGAPGTEAGDWLLVLTMRDGRVGIVMDEVEDLQVSAGARALPVLDIEALVLPLLAAEPGRA
jgi:purine-binding chemotaxis protein CheW